MLESKRKAIIFITLSLLLAAIAGFMFLQKVKALNTNLGEMAEIYVASSDIPSRTVIKEEQVQTVEIPKKFMNDSYITDKKDFVDKISKVPLSDGAIITDIMLKKIKNRRDADSRLVGIHEGNNVQFDQVPEPFDRVDIIVSREVEGEPITEIFMKNIPVKGIYSKEDDQFRGALVEVSIEDAPKLIHAENYAAHIRVLKANAEKATEEELKQDEGSTVGDKTEEGSEKAKNENKESNKKTKSDNKKDKKGND